jgi:outer membrane lipoprotein-sorting protein
MIMIKKFIFLVMLALLPFVSVAAEVKPSISFLSDAQNASHLATVTRVQNYLSNLTTLVSEFTQTAPDGSIASGKFYLQRPEKMRWQYNPPTPILIVANGSELVYYDSELEQISYIPLGSTLIGFLAEDKISFDKSVGITSFYENAGVIRIGVAQRDKPSDGNLVLEFSDKPLILRSMVVTDAGGQITNVSLNNAEFGARIDSKLFDFKDPRKKKNR